jgi:hypothetical protein
VNDQLLLGDRTEALGLSSYLTRLLALDTRASVRVQADGTALGVWGGPPLGVLTLRPVGLGEPAQLDRTLSAQRLLEAIDAAGEQVAVNLPPVIGGPPWAGLLPSRAGWSWLAAVPVAVIVDAVRVAVEGFGRRVDLIDPSERTQPALEAVANELWNKPVLSKVPLRAAHAAQLTGLLGRDGEVSAHASGSWLRLSCPGGSVALRGDGTVGLGLDLNVWALGSGLS